VFSTSRHALVHSEHPLVRAGIRAFRAARRFTLPAPRLIVRPIVVVFLGARTTYYALLRVLVCEPFFKSYCTSYGRGVRTGVFLHWIQGQGRIELGDDVIVDGKCSFTFAARYTAHPTLRIGSHTGIGHGCSFTVGDAITIGDHCRIGNAVLMFDSSGHSSDPALRLADAPAAADSVRPITIERNVWIGDGAVIFPGVTVGENSVISARAVVVTSVPPNSVMLGNPARRMAST
jgi:acetyltransferase-like isoleucine patch superfamily enzyme